MDPKTRAVMEHLVEESSTPARMRGVGDVVAKVTKAMGFTPCEPCKRRQEILNRRFPFKAKPKDGQ